MSMPDTTMAVAKGFFIAPQLIHILGITKRQQDYWARTGILEPSISSASGSGTQRRYSYLDAIIGMSMMQLRAVGFAVDSAATAAAALRAVSEDELDSAILLITAEGVSVVHSGMEMAEALMRSPGARTLLPIGPLTHDLDSRIKP